MFSVCNYECLFSSRSGERLTTHTTTSPPRREERRGWNLLSTNRRLSQSVDKRATLRVFLSLCTRVYIYVCVCALIEHTNELVHGSCCVCVHRWEKREEIQVRKKARYRHVRFLRHLVYHPASRIEFYASRPVPALTESTEYTELLCHSLLWTQKPWKSEAKKRKIRTQISEKKDLSLLAFSPSKHTSSSPQITRNRKEERKEHEDDGNGMEKACLPFTESNSGIL